MIFLALMDYTGTTIELTLDGVTTRVCTDITVLDDDSLEDVERFMVLLTTEDPRTDIDRDQSTIEIADNDGKSTKWCFNKPRS